MNWDAVSAVAEFLGAVGVIVTLLYLTRQVRDNTASIRRATTRDALQTIADFNQFVASDPVLVDLFWRGSHTPEELFEVEWQRFVSLGSTLIRRFEFLYLDHASGALGEELWMSQANNIRTWMTTPGVRRWMEELGDHVHPGFRRFLEGLQEGTRGEEHDPRGS